MNVVCLPVLWVAFLTADGRAPAAAYLYQPSYSKEDCPGPVRPYLPQPGDIILTTDRSRIIRAGHWLVGCDGVHHSALVFAQPDGSLAVLEAGPFNSLRVEIVDLMYLLTRHDERGENVWIRQRRMLLTAEQSAKLTAWALAQNGKRFAGLRMLGQLTVFRSRGPLRTHFIGGPHGERSSYFCSELVMESCVAAGIWDAARARPAATYPRDLFTDRSTNAFLREHLDLSACWFPPARWTLYP